MKNQRSATLVHLSRWLPVGVGEVSSGPSPAQRAVFIYWRFLCWTRRGNASTKESVPYTRTLDCIMVHTWMYFNMLFLDSLAGTLGTQEGQTSCLENGFLMFGIKAMKTAMMGYLPQSQLGPRPAMWNRFPWSLFPPMTGNWIRGILTLGHAKANER